MVEAFHLYQQGEAWHLTGSLAKDAAAEQKERYAADPMLHVVADWLADPVGWDWSEDNEGKLIKTRYKYDASNGVLTGDVVAFALEKPKGQINKADHMRAAEILGELGYVRGPLRTEDNGARVRRYVKSSSPPAPPADPKGGAA